MIKEAIDRIAELARQATDRAELTQNLTLPYDGGEQEYLFELNPTATGTRIGGVVQPFYPSSVNVTTLTGFADALKAKVAGELGPSRIIHVEDYLTVKSIDAEPDKFGKRNVRLIAKHTPPGHFNFEEYMPAEKFIIGLQTCFLFIDEGDKSDWQYVMRIASNLKAGESVHSQDDGINQTVTCKIGSVESTQVNVKARVKLCPLRTFYECPPVISEFLLRLRPHPQNQLPLIALFPLDGTKWQGETMLAIKHYLEKHVPQGTTILA